MVPGTHQHPEDGTIVDSFQEWIESTPSPIRQAGSLKEMDDLGLVGVSVYGFRYCKRDNINVLVGIRDAR
jgi:hypothetical protein